MFTFKYIHEQLMAVKAAGYEFMGLRDYVLAKKRKAVPERVAVLRVDVDRFLKRTEGLVEVFLDVGVLGSFFFRLHSPDYNLLDFESYRILKFCRDSGHEIGLHTELIDQSAIWNEDPEVLFKKDLVIFSSLIERPVFGTAAHRDISGRNNLDFWQSRKPEDFGLLYEGYDRSPNFGLFDTSRYVSDSEWYQWKSYQDGVLRAGDRRAPAEHAADLFADPRRHVLPEAHL